ncbi:outer membrane beta-barrel protein [Spirosoma sp. HMF3257]|uniref:PorT family protein n=2 Tax=Spirosoma telluris TaxID=2183553 RepID=A0A327NV32_9BACT|nr:outer membrane beta-barrel protein [Spirosoma telluris]RAI78453.1 PorT family protein [Spirosoma telluris]
MYMYRFVLLLSIVTSPLVLKAQSDKPIGGHFGVKIGASFTQIAISGSTVNIPHRSLQPHLGLMYRYRYNRWVVQPEAILSIRGGTFQQEQSNGTRTTTGISYYYASLPLMLGYIPTEGLTVQAGPEFSYALNAGQTGGPSANNDLGLAVGVHYDFLDMLNKFSLNVRFIYGFTNVSPEATAAYYNRNLQVSMVYNLFPKKKKK